MSEYFQTVKAYLQELDLDIAEEDAAEELVVVDDEDRGIRNLIVDCEDPILILEQAVMPLPKKPGDLYRRLLEMNRTLIHGAFATGGGQMGGKEHTVVSLLLFMINNRMVVAGPLFSDAEGDDKWAELGAGAMTGPIDPGIADPELDSAHRLGERIARLAKKMSAR